MGHCKKKTYNTDTVMKQLFQCLVSDFSPELCGLDKRLRSLSVESIRGFQWPAKSQAPARIFKRVYQLENLWKRYTFAPDVYTNADLESLTLEKFLATQIRIGRHMIPQTPLMRNVVKTTRRIIREILGSYDLIEHMTLCRFGRKATVGQPLRDAYLDTKVGVATGSLQHIQWYKENTACDTLLKRAEGECENKHSFVVCDSLALTNVPKTWKSLRTIMPNTSLGVFYTSGLGEVISERLRNAGLDIRTLQVKHQRYAKRYSITRTGATADLSAASDSFTASLLQAILPRKWYELVKFGRVPNVTLPDGRVIQLTSFMGMGIGFTFPLQTLCFYGILKAIQELSGIRGVISVYGDDLIYPRMMHRYVQVIFTKLGFLLNTDKTFCVDYFRESCGGDFYRGVDVRPFQPEGSCQLLNRLDYLGFLYKTVNGLLRRWHELEIPSTLCYLQREILRVTHEIHEVPTDYPDFAGIKTGRLRKEWYVPWSVIHSKTGYLSFRCLATSSSKRKVVAQSIYLWERLRTSFRDVCEASDLEPAKTLPFWARHFKETPTPILNWHYHVKHGRRGPVKRLLASVPENLSTRLIVSVGTVPNWAFGEKSS